MRDSFNKIFLVLCLWSFIYGITGIAIVSIMCKLSGFDWFEWIK